MKKKIIIILLSIVGLGLLYVLFNQIDAPAPVNGPDTSTLPRPVLDKSNGYFLLWGLTEPDDVNVDSEEIRKKYLLLGEPLLGDKKETRDRSDLDYKYRKMFGAKYNTIQKKIRDIGQSWMNPLNNPNEDWMQKILSQQEQVDYISGQLSVWLKRYELLVQREVFTDFGVYSLATPIPNLLAWLRVGRLYNVQQMLLSRNGNWEQGVAAILRHLEFCKRAQKGSSLLILNLIGKALMIHSLQALSAIMNQKECPESVFQQVLAGLKPLTLHEYSCHNGLIGEILAMRDAIYQGKLELSYYDGLWDPLFTGLFLQKNRTYQAVLDRFAPMLENAKTPPYQWKTDPSSHPKETSGWFWWLQNPAGKLFLAKSEYSFPVVLQKSYRLVAYYDLVRIAAELHLQYRGDKPVEEILPALESYHSIDPFTGKFYHWQEQKQVLYSLGPNQRDDGGVENPGPLEHDLIMPCILYVKPTQE